MLRNIVLAFRNDRKQTNIEFRRKIFRLKFKFSTFTEFIFLNLTFLGPRFVYLSELGHFLINIFVGCEVRCYQKWGKTEFILLCRSEAQVQRSRTPVNIYFGEFYNNSEWLLAFNCCYKALHFRCLRGSLLHLRLLRTGRVGYKWISYFPYGQIRLFSEQLAQILRCSIPCLC